MFKAAGSTKGWSWSVEGGKLHCDILFWGKPLESVTSGSARRRTSVDTYLGPDRPRGWSWLSRAGRAGMDQGLWSPGCTDCGSPGFTQSCFFRGLELTKPISTNWAGSKQMLLTREQDCRAVTSSSGGEGDTFVPHPSLLTLSALQFCSQLFSVWHYKSPLFFYGHIWNILFLIMQSICFSSLHLFVWMLCWVFSMYLIFLKCYMLIASNFLLLHLLATSA